jgi:hypothetical protein
LLGRHSAHSTSSVEASSTTISALSRPPLPCSQSIAVRFTYHPEEVSQLFAGDALSTGGRSVVSTAAGAHPASQSVNSRLFLCDRYICTHHTLHAHLRESSSRSREPWYPLETTHLSLPLNDARQQSSIAISAPPTAHRGEPHRTRHAHRPHLRRLAGCPRALRCSHASAFSCSVSPVNRPVRAENRERPTK